MRRLQATVVFAMFVLCVSSAHAQTVVTSPLSVSAVCLGDSVTVSYIATGSFAAKNAFTAQISAPDGSFTGDFRSLGSVRSTTSGSIRVWISPTLAAGSTYRIRVNASTPYTAGSDNGSNLTLSAHADAGFSMAPQYRELLEGDSRTFTAWDATPGDTHTWTFNHGTTSWTLTGPVVTPTFPTIGDYSVRHEVTNAGGCVSVWDSSGLAAYVHAYTCSPQIPDTVLIDSVESGFPDSTEHRIPGAVWVVPGATLAISRYDIHVVYAEAGSIVHNIGGAGIVVYLKDGASFEGGNNGRETIIYSSGAGMTHVSPYSTKLLCPNLNFDYSVAPPYKILPAGVASTGTASGIELRPNPASRTLLVELPEAPQRIRVLNVVGNEVLSFDHALDRTMDLGIGTLPNGVYYLRIEKNGQASTQSFVISK
jgi:hypothetical protein